jgi:MFS transporter, UMF1 family
MLKKNDPNTIAAWCMYDWANSAFALTVVSAIFPVYYSSATRHGDSTIVPFFGMMIENSVLFSYAVSLSFLLLIVLTPILTSLADAIGRKKVFMQITCYLGALGCLGLFFFTGDNVEWGILCFVLGLIGFGGSIVFYNSYLPEIATVDKIDAISARGFMMGYSWC